MKGMLEQEMEWLVGSERLADCWGTVEQKQVLETG